MNDLDTQKSRYVEFGGIEKVGKRFSAGDLTLSEVAARVVVSRETVRNDLKKYFGQDWYKATMNLRRETNKMPKPIFGGRDLSADQAIQALNSHERPFSDTEAKAGIAAVEMLAGTGKLSAFRLRASGLAQAKTSKGWANVRLFVANPSLKEFCMGLYRLKPTRKLCEANLEIYGIYHEKQMVMYVFSKNEIAGISSLNLRFADMNRNSKYSFARSRWDIL